MTDNVKCSGGCGKTWPNQYPAAVVTCMPCAMKAAEQARKHIASLPQNEKRLAR